LELLIVPDLVKSYFQQMDATYVQPTFNTGDTVVRSIMRPNAYHRVHYVILQLRPDIFPPAILDTKEQNIGSERFWRLNLEDTPEEVAESVNAVYYQPLRVFCS
jgi:hypothetical protein